jgi:outer membrane protein OmpA-like peptidoglycan-associated protein
MTQDDELEKLKHLLFSEELETIRTLHKHLLDPQQRITDTAGILADSIKIAATDNQRLVTALNEPVAECIRNIVQQKPQEFADSLFPVIGPAIRKSISEALKSFVQSTNEMVELSMSPKSLRWRWEAKRSGVPFSDIVLKHSLLYRVEEVFLIQQGTGLLIEHVSHPDVVINDSDAISAMLTVIRDFSHDSFSAEASESLETVEFGERTLWIVEGPNALLACVNRGMVPMANRTVLQSVLEKFHMLYGAQIEQYSGDRGEHPALQELLATCLTQQSKASESATEASSESTLEKHHWLSNPCIWVALTVLLMSGYWLWQHYDQQRRTDALLTELQAIAGVVVIGTEENGDTLLVKGLLDPMASPLDALAPKHGFNRDEIQFQMALYQSLDPLLAVQRAAQLLDAPKTVALSVQGQQLIVNGIASQQWLDFAVKLKDRIPGFNAVNFEQLKVTEWLQAAALQQELDGISFYFSEGATFNTEQQNHVQVQMDKVSQLLKLLTALKTDIRFVVEGYADGVGNAENNHALKLKRAESIKQALVRSGVSPSSISVVAGQLAADTKQTNTLIRKAELRVKLLRPD